MIRLPNLLRICGCACLAASLAACNLPVAAGTPTLDAGLIGTIAAQTLEALNTPIPASTRAAPANSPSATMTVTATITPTYAIPLANFDGDTNCRQGPGTNYKVETVVRAGQKAEVVGKAETGNYWIIKNPNGEGTCWVAGDFTRTSGSLQLLPTMTAPPTPTPEPPKTPTWKTWNFSCTFAPGGSDMTVVMEWSDNANNETGYNLLRNDQVVVSLGPDSTTYTDVSFVAAGQSVSYVIEAYNAVSHARSSAIKATCQ